MGKGDKKTKRGKIFAGSYGKTRPKPKKAAALRRPPVEEKKPAKKAAAPKKKAAAPKKKVAKVKKKS